MNDPKKGEFVRLHNGCLAEVIDIGSIVTDRGSVPLYNKFSDGGTVSVNCLREEFTFPI